MNVTVPTAPHCKIVLKVHHWAWIRTPFRHHLAVQSRRYHIRLTVIGIRALCPEWGGSWGYFLLPHSGRRVLERRWNEPDSGWNDPHGARRRAHQGV